MNWQKKHDGLIVLDFDHTLFNTTKYVEVMQKYFDEKFGVLEDEFMAEREAVKDCCIVVDIDKFTARLSNQDKDGMHEAMITILRERVNEFVWPDAMEFVKKHMENFDLVLLTHGDTELQREKIVNSELASLPYLITIRAKSEEITPHVKRYNKMYFIDDKPANIEDMKRAFPEAEMYLMKRWDDQPYGEQEIKCKCEHRVVHDLKFTIDH